MNLNQFLVRAKKSTYAAEGETGEKKLSDGGKMLEFAEGNFHYRDTYYGFNPFSGQEVVWKDGEVVWAMNYYGRVISGEPNKVYGFLREALQNVGEDKPFRGPSEFSRGLFRYAMRIEGNTSQFSGDETIHHGNELVFVLKFHGGRIQPDILK